ncbi:Tripartite tricarboxylate transporter family receptor [Marinovum algicola]|uniref:Tripartite-type tricarboxylate transporter, receptor component TctC n=1 Tax=Marinovum algicola TaxID=42444 RepID=A0A975WFA8_9RHOB|nr:tripartite tricarboxylate transporter substrate binding protein [Marinovum algicola]SEK10419.1 Tripartite-type tricarboxylate transporter, receptor component TctC [Marinovum algicola]SLN77165.1 Tripartite tricarboxylate transporter family receptor [Marinovum algicola]
MTFIQTMVRGIAAASVAATLGTAALVASATPAAAEFPSKPIQVYVGYRPGGRTDTVARKISTYINENNLLPQPLVIVNVPGAASANAAREVLGAEPDGHTIMMWSHSVLVSNALGVNEIHPEDFTSLGFTGGGSPVWTVRDDAPYQTLEELIDALRAEPQSLTEAVGIGTVPHIVGLMLARKAGFETRLIGAPGGADRLARLLGGNADIALFSGSEYLSYKPNGIRALTYFGANRLPAIGDVPTAAELGYDVVWANPLYWLAPDNLDAEAEEIITTALQAAVESDEMQAWFTENTLEPYWTDGAAALASSLDVLTRLKVVAEEAGLAD